MLTSIKEHFSYYRSINDSPLATPANAQNKIHHVALNVFLKLSVALAFNISVMSFFATPLGIPLTTTVILGALAEIAVRETWTYHTKQDAQEKDYLEKAQQLVNFSFINLFGLAWINQAIHESGHALSALLFFKKANPKCMIFPFESGRTSYAVSYGLTKIGSFLGKERAILFTAAAGITFSTLFTMIEFAVAFCIKDGYPSICEGLNCHAISQLLNEVIYGLMALFINRSDLTHDFLRLWHLGEIHPLIPITLMVALPAIEVLLLRNFWPGLELNNQPNPRDITPAIKIVV